MNPPNQMNQNLRERLNRLNENRPVGAATAPVSVPRMGNAQPLESLTDGRVEHNELGASFMIPTYHAPDHVHGARTLSSWLTQDLTGAAAFSRDARLLDLDPRRCLFLDTETTGLSSGAGTLVFLVGIGLFTDQGFEVRQFFLRDPTEEAAMLHAIHLLLQEYTALVTFNGRSFDIPLLASRYALRRQRIKFDSWSNLDLLHPARRLWKRRLESCRLSALESAILGVRRTGEDVPGWMIPQMYYDYIRSGDARPMQSVIYHNLIDVLSMVTLATHLCETFAQPETADLPCDDMISLAKWYDSLGKVDQAESAYASALAATQRSTDHVLILENLGALLKRQERWEAAAACWQSLADLQPASLTPCLELAKYHEWQSGDLEQARAWTDVALRIANAWGASLYRDTALTDLQHRRDRIAHKQ